MSKMGDFRFDGIPNSAEHAYKRATDISTATELVSGIAGQSVVLCDIIFTCSTDHQFTFLDGTNEILDFHLKASSNGDGNFSHSFVAPVDIASSSGLYIKSDGSNTDWSCLVTYYRTAHQ